jgi:prepilin-type N-terminal cleavage/methylation domain-containing protein
MIAKKYPAGSLKSGQAVVSRRLRHRTFCKNGFTLVEILITIAILVIGLAAVFQVTRSGLQRMTMSRELTEAQNACQAVLNELLARSVPIQPDAGKTIEHLPHWKIRVDIYPASQSGLYVLHLSAEQFSPEGAFIAVRYQLLRWIPAERVQFPEPSEMFMENEFDDWFY